MGKREANGFGNIIRSKREVDELEADHETSDQWDDGQRVTSIIRGKRDTSAQDPATIIRGKRETISVNGSPINSDENDSNGEGSSGIIRGKRSAVDQLQSASTTEVPILTSYRQSSEARDPQSPKANHKLLGARGISALKICHQSSHSIPMLTP